MRTYNPETIARWKAYYENEANRRGLKTLATAERQAAGKQRRSGGLFSTLTPEQQIDARWHLDRLMRRHNFPTGIAYARLVAIATNIAKNYEKMKSRSNLSLRRWGNRRKNELRRLEMLESACARKQSPPVVEVNRLEGI